jgi:hypothetical protein
LIRNNTATCDTEDEKALDEILAKVKTLEAECNHHVK